jgi:hypothetical protein
MLLLITAKLPDKYPSNLLRNKALASVTTPLVFMLDVDLIPDPGFYAYLESRKDFLLKLTPTTVFTIPAFQITKNESLRIGELKLPTLRPKTKAELMGLVSEARAEPILADAYFVAFACLDFPRWYAATEMYAMTYAWPCEPYIIGATADMPIYDERFVDYGNDKATHLLDLFYGDHLFGVLPDHFLIHERHELAEWANDDLRNKQVDALEYSLVPTGQERR